MMRIIAIIGLLIAGTANAEPIAKELFGHIGTPSSEAPESYGSYALGCMAGGQALSETGPAWQAMRLSRNRYWGQPELISFVERLADSAVDAGWAGLYVGDISQPRGGPMLSGHASHQIGLDVDVWMLPPDRLDLSRSERESLSSISVVSDDLRTTNSNWTPAHHEVIMAALRDPALARIFVGGAIKMRMCEDVNDEERPYLRKLRPWWGHTSHFHIRLNCPDGNPNCVEQAPPPAGDGCADAVWWVTDALAPPDPDAPPVVPRAEYVMADLPQQCEAVLQSQ